MGQQVTIGGDRLGNNNKNKVWLREYERSTHDLGFVWKSTMSVGTLVPFMSRLALPGDTWDINLYVDAMTQPTIGPLFGAMKVQLDCFIAPIRLYQAKLHMNMLDIGMKMSDVKLPQVRMKADGNPDYTELIDNQQINPSSIWKYLGISGLGYSTAETPVEITRDFNAIPYLAYWEIYKNYYANKQEEIGYVIHKDVSIAGPDLTDAVIENTITNAQIQVPGSAQSEVLVTLTPDTKITVTADNLYASFEIGQLMITVHPLTGLPTYTLPITQLFGSVTILPAVSGGTIFLSDPIAPWLNQYIGIVEMYDVPAYNTAQNGPPQLVSFDLDAIDNMRKSILQHATDAAFIVSSASPAPYGLSLQEHVGVDDKYYSKNWSQEGLAIKTYNSDLLNNWIRTEFIDGTDSISELTAIDTSGGSFTIDELNLNKKVYDMLNRIAISGGSYDDWLDAVYTHDRKKSMESPMYIGGLIQTLGFQEVVSNAASGEQPLGTLAGRGRLGQNRKGGEIIAKIDEPSYIMGIVSITPYLDYTTGNQWDVNLKTMNDFHKPALDEIGFQDLITEQMAWWDTGVSSTTPGALTYKSAGKQPAWINYMTDINRAYGNFAIQANQMFMVLARGYTMTIEDEKPTIADVTTYIDPTKFNNIFADVQLDAQNYWMQIAVDIKARRKMSAKVMPNL